MEDREPKPLMYQPSADFNGPALIAASRVLRRLYDNHDRVSPIRLNTAVLEVLKHGRLVEVDSLPAGEDGQVAPVPAPSPSPKPDAYDMLHEAVTIADQVVLLGAEFSPGVPSAD